MAIYSKDLVEEKHILFFPSTPLPNTPKPALVKGYLHLLYLTLFTPCTQEYLLYKIYPLLDLYIAALRFHGYQNLGNQNPDHQHDSSVARIDGSYLTVDYPSIIKMVIAERLEEDLDTQKLLDCIIPTLCVNVPHSVYPTRTLPFLGFTLEGAINTYADKSRVVVLDTAKIVEMNSKKIPPLVKWFYYFYMGLSEMDFNVFVEHDLSMVTSPCIPRFNRPDTPLMYTTIVNLLNQMVELIRILDLRGRYYDRDFPRHPSNWFSLPPSKHEFMKERLPIQYPAICRIMWGNLLYGGVPFLRVQHSFSLRELFQHIVGKLNIKQKQRKDLTIAEQAMDFALVMMDGYGLESADIENKTSLALLDPVSQIRAFQPRIGIEASAPQADDEVPDEDEENEDPSTAPIQTSPDDAQALQGGNNPSASVQSNSPMDNPDEDAEMPDNSMGSSTNPAFAPGSNIDAPESGPLAPFTGDPMNLTDASNDYYYKLSVAALNKKLNESGVTAVTPYVKNTLGSWCQLGMWLYPASNTRTIVSKLGLEKYLSVFNRKNLRKQ